MIRRMTAPLFGLALLTAMTAGLMAKALMIAPPPVGMRVAAAGAAVVGKVTKLDDKAVPAEMFKGDTRQLTVATVKVEQALLGKAGKEIKVGFVPPMAAGGGLGGPRRPIRGGVTLTADQEAMLILVPHPTKKDLFVVNDMFSVINKKDNPGFEAELTEVKKAAKMLSEPVKALKAKDADERWFATALLVSRYRTAPTPDAKTEKASAEESKLILTNLAEADWDMARGGPRGGFMTNPQQSFFQLGLTPADGWNQPRDFTMLQAEAKKWLKENAGKYRVVRYVRPSLEKGIDPEP